MSDADFLAFVDSDPHGRWELIDGQPVAMATGSVGHAMIGGNIAEAIGPVARKRGCRALRDLYFRLAANDGGQDYIPDVMVRCGPAPLQDRMIDDARAIFEVLSPSTMVFNRGAKLDAYLRSKTVDLVALIYPREWRVEAWSRAPGEAWPEEPLILRGPQDALPIPLLDINLSLAAMYEGAEPE